MIVSVGFDILNSEYRRVVEEVFNVKLVKEQEHPKCIIKSFLDLHHHLLQEIWGVPKADHIQTRRGILAPDGAVYRSFLEMRAVTWKENSDFVRGLAAAQ